MNTKEIQTEVNAIIANCSPEVQETVNQIIEKILIEIDAKDQIRDNEKVAKEPAPEPSLIVKHILDIKSVQAQARECLRWLDAYCKSADFDKKQFQYYGDKFIEFVLKLPQAIAVDLVRQALNSPYSFEWTPGQMFNYDEFYRRHGKYIVEQGKK